MLLYYTFCRMSLSRVIAFFAPDECMSCEMQPEVLCASCATDYVAISSSICFRCSRSTNNNRLCSGCYRVIGLKHLWFVGYYDEKAKNLIHKLKFDPNRSAARLLADFLDTAVPHKSSFVVVHLPTAPKRVRQRGFDHAKLIAQQFSEARNLPCLDVLIRTGNNRQVGTSKQQRIKQIKGAYTVVASKHIKNKNVLLIDDVVTTGASLAEASEVLKKAGAKSVSAAVYAVARLN